MISAYLSSSCQLFEFFEQLPGSSKAGQTRGLTNRSENGISFPSYGNAPSGVGFEL